MKRRTLFNFGLPAVLVVALLVYGIVERNTHILRDGKTKPEITSHGKVVAYVVPRKEIKASIVEKGGSIVYRFHARDLHLVLGPGPEGKPVRFRVTIDGAPPGGGRGTDVDGDGQGVVTGQRLYQLIRQDGKVSDHTFEIQFLDPGVQAYAFTFG